MKKMMLTIISAIFCFSLFAADLTEAQVPVAVKNALSKKYANVQKVEWDKEGTFYQAEFKFDKRDHEVLLDEKGNIVKIHEDIAAGDLPAKVSQAIQKSHPGHKIDDVEKVTKDNSVLYKVELKGGGSDTEVYYNKDGEVIQLPIK